MIDAELAERRADVEARQDGSASGAFDDEGDDYDGESRVGADDDGRFGDRNAPYDP